MNKKYFWLFLGIFVFLLCSTVSLAEDKSLTDLVKKIGATGNSELSSLDFFELNILKNSIYSAKGYQYATDREWLYSYFYKPEKEKSLLSVLLRNKWDLRDYSFPAPKKGDQFKIDKDMEKAIANIRVAIYKKIRSYKSLSEVDKEIDTEISFYNVTDNRFIFGRAIGGVGDTNVNRFGESIRREVHGYKCVINIIDKNANFDACELLGVYLGSVVLLKNIIEAQNGKIFGGVTGWEISQLVGVTSNDTEYDPNNLPQNVRSKLQMLDNIIQKMTQSGIGDLPVELKDNSENISLAAYFEGC